MNIALFTYDRPHWKTELFLKELVSLGYKPSIIFAAPWRKLKLPKMAVTSVKHLPTHPQVLANRYKIRYEVIEHDRVNGQGFDLGIIGGARILGVTTINSFRLGILNMHPGKIPENRGLQNMARAIRDKLPHCVTAHMIDARIDAGKILRTYHVPMEKGDSIMDLGEKYMDCQVALLKHVLPMIESSKYLNSLPSDTLGYEEPMPHLAELNILAEWEDANAH